jgi:NADH dehydrogenase (ubiquinone) 1 alpha/beta subcomplex 1
VKKMLRNASKLFHINRSIFNQKNAYLAVRWYGTGQEQHAAPKSYLDRAETSERVINVLKKHEKVDPAKVSEDSHFVKDLGLDSLDSAEIICEIEQEFVMEIPNEEAFKLQSVRDVINYVCASPLAK